MANRKVSNINSLSTVANLILTGITGIFALICVYPVLLIIISSFTSEKSLAKNGYRLFPKEFSLNAYKYILNEKAMIFSSYSVSIIITLLGTIISLSAVAMLAYPLSRSYFKYRNKYSLFVFFTMVFNGGMVPSYIINSHYLHITNSIWALILPLVVNAFNVIILKTFFISNIPDSLIESTKIDGAGEFTSFIKIAVPISKPGLATIGLFQTINYWNDWFNALLYINNNKYVPLQLLLMRIQNSIDFIAQNKESIASVNQDGLLTNLPTETVRMAIVLLAIGPIIFAYPFFQRYFIKGMTIGAVKG
jgi:putative aldouronate transport system permease protein